VAKKVTSNPVLGKLKWAEIPPFDDRSLAVLLQEIMALKERVGVLETQTLELRIIQRPGVGIKHEIPRIGLRAPTKRGGGPAELPRVTAK
jgi:hypothetical protein